MSILCKILLFSLAISFGADANTSFHTVFVKSDNKTLTTFAVSSDVKMDISSDQFLKDKNSVHHLLKDENSVQRFVGNARLILSYPTGSVVIMRASEIDISG